MPWLPLFGGSSEGGGGGGGSGGSSSGGPRREPSRSIITSAGSSRSGIYLPPRAADPGRTQRWLTVKNTSGEIIPAYAAIEPHGVDRDGAILVRKPTQDDSNRALLNSGAVIGIGDYGVGTNHMATWAYYHDGDGTPATGESLGTQAGQWKLYRGYEGFLVWGGADEFGIGIVKVQRDLDCRDLTRGGYYYDYPRPSGYCCGCERFSCIDIWTSPSTLDCIVTNSLMGTVTIAIPRLIDGDCSRINERVTYGVGATVIDDTPSAAGRTDCDGLGVSPEILDYSERITVDLRCVPNESTEDINHRTICDGVGFWYTRIVWEKVIGGEMYILSACGSFENIASCDPFYLAESGETTCGEFTLTPKCAHTSFAMPVDHVGFNLGLDGTTTQVEFVE